MSLTIVDAKSARILRVCGPDVEPSASPWAAGSNATGNSAARADAKMQHGLGEGQQVQLGQVHGQMAPGQVHGQVNGQMVPGQMASGQVHGQVYGQMAPGQMAPGQMASGQVHGQVHGQMAPGQVHGQMASGQQLTPSMYQGPHVAPQSQMYSGPQMTSPGQMPEHHQLMGGHLHSNQLTPHVSAGFGQMGATNSRPLTPIAPISYLQNSGNAGHSGSYGIQYSPPGQNLREQSVGAKSYEQGTNIPGEGDNGNGKAPGNGENSGQGYTPTYGGTGGGDGSMMAAVMAGGAGIGGGIAESSTMGPPQRPVPRRPSPVSGDVGSTKENGGLRNDDGDSDKTL